jgi:hypothetical protein
MKTKGRVSAVRKDAGVLLIIKEVSARSPNVVEKGGQSGKAVGSKRSAEGRD